MAVDIQSITKSYGINRALDKISLKIKEGMLFGLIGPDGAGKSTLFRIIASLLIPDEGTCRVFDFDSITDYRKIRQIIGYMPGRFSLYYDLSVEENLKFYATVYGTSFEKNYDLIKPVYEQIEPFRQRLARNLSGGMKQKLALSCALIHRPRLLLLDEPTTGVDAVSRMEFWELLALIKKEGITIIVSTPYMDEANLCDQIALIQKGKILSISTPKAIKESSEMLLYSLRSGKGSYRHLSSIRELDGCKSAWLFGDELHVAIKDQDFLPAIRKTMAEWGDESIIWERINPNIEDIFIDLMQAME